MPRQKKSRKVGKIGVAKTSSNVRKPTEKRVKKHLGKPAGSRNNESMTTQSSPTKKVIKDPRHGSKKPINLIVDTHEQKPASKKTKYFSPTQELAAIEQNPRLSSLLDKIDLGKNITQEDQHFVDQTLARHKVLCDMLGLTDEPAEATQTSDQETDLFSEFESININDFKN